MSNKRLREHQKERLKKAEDFLSKKTKEAEEHFKKLQESQGKEGENEANDRAKKSEQERHKAEQELNELKQESRKVKALMEEISKNKLPVPPPPKPRRNDTVEDTIVRELDHIIEKTRIEESNYEGQLNILQTTGNKESTKDVEGKIKRRKSRIKEIKKLKEQLKGKSSQFIIGFLNEYKNGKGDILKPIEKTLQQIKEKAELEAKKADLSRLTSSSIELFDNVKAQEKRILDRANKFKKGASISEEILDDFDWQKKINNDLYHNNSPLKELNQSRVQLYIAIASDTDTIKDKNPKMKVDLNSSLPVLPNLEQELTSIKEEIEKSENAEELEILNKELNDKIKSINDIKIELGELDRKHNETITESINSATQGIISQEKIKFNSKETGPILLGTLKSLEEYDKRQKDLNIELRFPNKDEGIIKDIPYYFLKGEGKEEAKVEENLQILKKGQNKVFENLISAKDKLNKKVENSKTLDPNRKGNKNEDIKKAARSINASLKVMLEKMQVTHDQLDAVNPESTKTWIIPDQTDNNLNKFVEEVTQIANEVTKKIGEVYNELEIDTKKAAQAKDNIQTRGYEDYGPSVNSILIKGIPASVEINKLESDLNIIERKINIEIKSANNKIEKVKAYFGLAQAAANTVESAAQLVVSSVGATVPTSNQITSGDETKRQETNSTLKIPPLKLNGIIEGVGHLLTLGSQQHLETIKVKITELKGIVKEKKALLESMVVTAQEAQKSILGKEEVFLPQINTEEFISEHKSLGYNDKMYGAFVAKQFKNTDNSATTSSKLDREATLASTERDRAAGKLLNNIRRDERNSSKENPLLPGQIL